MTAARKVSPRAPSFALEDAIERAIRIYDKERTHTVPLDVAAQDMGYNGARNGSAMSALATLRYYGLLERRDEGKVAVAKEVETYKFAPDEEDKREIVVDWLRNPPVFQDLLDEFGEALPSDATIRFNLIQRGFSPQAASSCVTVFKKSVEFAGYFAAKNRQPEAADLAEDNSPPSGEELNEPEADVFLKNRGATGVDPRLHGDPSQIDRIPVRLAGGRKAWIEVPAPFYSADRERLKSQIDLLLTDDEEEDAED